MQDNLFDVFQNHAAAVERMMKVSRPSDDVLLELYAYYKQATVGDCNTSKPMFWDIKGCAKWNAWNRLQGTGKEDAMMHYIATVRALKLTS